MLLLLDLVLLGAFVKVRRSTSGRPLSPPSPAGSRIGPARANLSEAAESLGFTLDSGAVVGPIRGARDGCEISVEPLGVLYDADRPHRYDMQVVLRNSALLDAQLNLRTHRRQDEPRTELYEVLQVGDPVFEQAYEVGGPPHHVRPRLGHARRARLLNLKGQITLLGRQLTYRTQGLFDGPEAIVAAVHEAQTALEALCAPEDPLQSLVQIAREDPEALVRAGALATLLVHWGQEPAVQEACELALTDPAPQVRLQAVRRVNAPEVLVELAQGPHPLALRVCAVQVLAETQAPDAALHHLLDMVAQEDLPLAVRIEVADTLARHSFEGAARPLSQHLKSAPRPLIVAMLRALGDLGDPECEPAVLVAGRSGPPAVREAAAGALGAVGTPAALGYVQDMLQTEDQPTVRDRLLWARAQILGRHPVEAGRLSVAPLSEAGALALTEEP